MNKFLVIYSMPIAGLEEWQKKPKEEREAEESELMKEWQAWLAANKDHVSDTSGVGKTKLVTAGGVSDTKNNMMLYSIATGESHEAVAEMFKNHPHLKIPTASIEIMTINSLPSA